ncbi:MAG: acyl carrier protein [Phycisphaerales bacterium]|nr:acyl carrier protein [Phycisphaerales bacterium]
MPETPTIDRVKAVIRTSLKLPAAAALDDEMPLVGGEYDLDSLDILLIITSIEKEFGIKVEDKKVGRAAFATVRTLTEFVRAQQEPPGVSAA